MYKKPNVITTVINRILTWIIQTSKHMQWSNDFDARCVHGDENHALLLVDLCVHVGLPHKDTQLAARVHGTCKKKWYMRHLTIVSVLTFLLYLYFLVQAFSLRLPLM